MSCFFLYNWYINVLTIYDLKNSMKCLYAVGSVSFNLIISTYIWVDIFHFYTYVAPKAYCVFDLIRLDDAQPIFGPQAFRHGTYATLISCGWFWEPHHPYCNSWWSNRNWTMMSVFANQQHWKRIFTPRPLTTSGNALTPAAQCAADPCQLSTSVPWIRRRVVPALANHIKR